MSQSVFPTLNTGTFNPVFWSLPGSKFTREYADLHYLKYPVGQGSQTIPANLNVSGTASLGTLIASGTSLLNKGYLMCNNNNTSFTQKDNTGLIGANNAFYGLNCANNITNGGTNCGFGQYNNLNSLTSGSGNCAFGNGALASVTTTNNNTGCGNNAGALTTGTNNTFLGNGATTTTHTENNSTAIGAGATITGSNQVVLGTANENVYIPGSITLRGTQAIKGIATGTYTGGAATGTISFGFTFANPPNVFATIKVYSTNQVFSIQVSSTTTTQFTFSKTWVLTSGAPGGGASEDFNWIAIGT